MTKVKVIFPLIAIAVMLYFSSIAFSTEPGNSKASCTIYVIVTSQEANCSGNFTYCINGGPAMTANGNFYADFPCDETSVICLTSDAGCWGRAFVTTTCPCEEDTFIILNIEPSPRACTCQ